MSTSDHMFYCSEPCKQDAITAYIESRPTPALMTAATITANRPLRPDSNAVVTWRQLHRPDAAKQGIPDLRPGGRTWTNIPLDVLETFTLNPYMQHGLDLLTYIAEYMPSPHNEEAFLTYIALCQPIRPMVVPGIHVPHYHRLWPWITARLADLYDVQTLNRQAAAVQAATTTWRQSTVKMFRGQQIRLYQSAVATRKSWLKGELDGLTTKPTGGERFRREWLMPNPSCYDEDYPDSFTVSKIQMTSIPMYKHWWPALHTPDHVTYILGPTLGLNTKSAAALLDHAYAVEEGLNAELVQALIKANPAKARKLKADPAPLIQASLIPDTDLVGAGRYLPAPDAPLSLAATVPWSTSTLKEIMTGINTHRAGDIESWTDYYIRTARWGGLNCDNATVGAK